MKPRQVRDPYRIFNTLRRCVITVSMSAATLLASPVAAFDTGPHVQMTADALEAEGFERIAIQVAQVSNFFTDLYAKSAEGKFAPIFDIDLDDAGALAKELSLRLHFDTDADLHNTADVEAEWNRLARATRHAVSAARNSEEVLVILGMSLHAVQDFYAHTNWVEAMAAEGPFTTCAADPFQDFLSCVMLLDSDDIPYCSCSHAACDFFALPPREGWADGPGFGFDGLHGTYPTWFDVAKADRDRTARWNPVYSTSRPNDDADVCQPGRALCESDVRKLHCTVFVDWDIDPYDTPLAASLVPPGYTYVRNHGDPGWRADMNFSLSSAVNKDSAGRPYYREAYSTAYYATRQWARAVQSWTTAGIWSGVRTYANRHDEYHLCANLGSSQPRSLYDDLLAMEKLSYYAGAWDGNGTAAGEDACYHGGNKAWAAWAGAKYVTVGCDTRTFFRRKWEELVPLVAADCPPSADVVVPSSRPIQLAAPRFVELAVNGFRDEYDGYDDFEDEDWQAKASIGYQTYLSGLVDNVNDRDLTLKPYGPWTFIKAMSRNQRYDEPVTTLEAIVTTAGAAGCGTTDSVSLRLGRRSGRLAMDLPGVADFLRGRTNRYPLAVPRGLRVRDLEYLQLEKSNDDSDDPWCVGAVTLLVNHRWFFRSGTLNVTLSAGHPRWRAPGFVPQAPLTTEVPVWLELWDLDQFSDEPMDLNAKAGMTRVNLRLNPQTGAITGDIPGPWSRRLVGGGGDDNKASADIAFRVRQSAPPPDLLRAVVSVYDVEGRRQQWLGPGTHRASLGDLSEVGEDAADTLVIPPGIRVRACCDEAGEGSDCQTITNETPAPLRKALDAARRNQVSFLEITPVVVAYSGGDFKGARQVFLPGTHRSSRLGRVGNNAISSLIVPPGVKVRGCVDDKRTYAPTDRCMVYAADSPGLKPVMDNAISNLEVWHEAVAFNGSQLSGTRRQGVRPGVYTGSDLTIGDNAIRSILVPPRWSVKACDDVWGAISCGTYTRSAIALGIGANVSYLKVRD